jgi:hypothetical protein
VFPENRTYIELVLTKHLAAIPYQRLNINELFKKPDEVLAKKFDKL